MISNDESLWYSENMKHRSVTNRYKTINDRSITKRSISFVGGVRGDVISDVLFLLRRSLVIVNWKLALTDVDISRVVVLAGSVHHGMKSILVGAVADHSNATTWFLHAVLAGHAASCGKERPRMNGSRETNC